MSRAPADPVSVLLPDASDGARERARRVTTFLRLLSAAARPRRAQIVGLDVPGVRRELEGIGHERRLAWTLTLLRHHVRSLLPADSFLAAPAACPDPARALREWTRELELAGEELPWTEPHPSARTCAEALLGVLRGLAGPTADETLLFEAYLAHLLRGPAAGERRWRALVSRGREPLASLAAAGVAAAFFERGRVRAARRWAAAPGRRGTELLRRLGAWAAVLETGAVPPTLPGATSPATGALPRPLCELRERVPALAPALQGPPPAGATQPLPFDDLLARTGAVAFVVLVLQGERAVALHWELAPRLRAAFDGWCAAHRGAHLRPGEPEHTLCRTARGLVSDRTGQAAPGGALSARARAVAREPWLDLRGAVCGWFHLELEHHLVPAGEQRRALALECAGRVGASALRDGPAPAPAAPDARRGAARALVRSLGPAAARRRWWMFAGDGDRPVLTGGGALGRAAPGRAGIVCRVRGEGVACAFDRPSPQLSVHPDAACGVAVPLVFAGRVHGVFALESERAGDLDEELRAAVAGAAARHAPSWRAAQFAAWHARRFARPVAFRLDGSGWCAALSALVVAARRREPVGLHGPPGVGRIVVARWLHFEGPGPAATIESLRGSDEGQTLARIAAHRPGGTLALAVECLTRPVRGALAARLRHERDRPPAERMLLVLFARERGDLAEGPSRLVRHALCVPPLAHRRDELPALLALLCEDAPLTPEGLGLLWRQPWRGNLPELAAFLAKARAEARGGALSPALLRAVAGHLGTTLDERLPTRGAVGDGRAEAVAAALALSRRPGGRPNKRRAAALLGWDPATLAQHTRREEPPARRAGREG